MGKIKKWIYEQIILTGQALLFIGAMPLLFLAVLLGFGSCWQCQRVGHVFTMRNYWSVREPDRKEKVCRSCSIMLKGYQFK